MRIHLLLDLRDTRDNHIDDPRVIVRFAHKEFGNGPATELPVRGRPGVVVADLADGGQYTVEVSPSLEADGTLIERIRAKTASGAEDYKNEPAKLHVQNFEWIPGFSFDPKALFSVKTKDKFGNLQLTVARGRIDGQDVAMLDADCDENGAAFAHLLDLPKHAVTGGTHPVEIFDILASRLPAWSFGYALAPARALTLDRERRCGGSIVPA